MKAVTLTLLALIFAITSQAQIITIRDQVTHQPLNLVAIVSPGLSLKAHTNSKGQTDLTAFKQADSIYFRLIGYKSVVFTYGQLQAKKFKLYLLENNITLNAVVISANRWQQEKKEVPAKISIISSKQVMLQNPQTAADLLELSGEVFIQKSQLGGGSPMIRGFATNRVLLTVDGVRMNTAIFRSGNLQNVISLDPFATERTEVIFGPGSVIYGSDAIAGVMSFFTLSPVLATGPKPQISANAVSRWSSANNEKTGHLDFNIGLKKWAFVTSATFTDYDHLKMGSKGPAEYLRLNYVKTVNGQDEMVANTDPQVQIPTGYSQYNFMQKIKFSPGQFWNFNYGFHYATTSDYPRYDRLIRYRNQSLRSAEWYYGPQEWLMNNLNLSHTANNQFFDKLNLNLAHQFFKESRHDRDFNRTIKYNRTEKVNAYSLNLDFEKTLGEKHLLLYGAEGIYNKVNSSGTDHNLATNTTLPGPARYPDGSDWHSYAAFFTYRYKASEQVNLQLGTRYNHFLLNAAFDTTFYQFPFSAANINTGALSGSMGLVYSPAPEWQLSSNLATGFRSPNVDDIGKVFDSTPGAIIIPNPSLQPEYAYNVDLGIARTFGILFKLDATAFYTYLDDALVRRNFRLNGQDSIMYNAESSRVEAIQNAAQAQVYGVQAGLEIKLKNGIGLSASLNYQKGTEELDNGNQAPLRHAAPLFGITRLTYSINKFKADLYAVYNGKTAYAELAPEEQEKGYLYASDENGKPYSPAWATLNLKALYKITDYLVATAGLENITDRRYRPYSSGLAAPGRNLILSVRAIF